MTTPYEVHVGDKKTRYEIVILDSDVPYDPSTSEDQEMYFLAPGSTTAVMRVAAIEPVTIDGVPNWLLVYELDATDPNDHALHAAEGAMLIQGLLRWANGAEFRTNKISTDVNGKKLQVVKNLEGVPGV